MPVKVCPICAGIACAGHQRKPSPSGVATSKYAHQKIRARLKAKVRTCHICGRLVEPIDMHADHVVPVSKGGSLTKENIRPSHSWCNLRKGNRTTWDNQATN